MSVIVPVRNGEHTIADCVGSLLALDYPRASRQILVVDNGSTDRTAAILRALGVDVLRESRRGKSHALNRAIPACRGEIVAFLDADCVAERRWLSELVAGFEGEGVGAVAGEIEPYRPRTVTERYVARREAGMVRFALELDRPFAPGANVAFRRSALQRVGGFDPTFTSGEDVDISWRLLEQGRVRITYRPGAIAYHRGRASPRALLSQQVGYGYGRALLRRRHGMPRGYALGRPIDLLRAIGALAAATARQIGGRGDRIEVRLAALEVLRRVALRLGAATLAVSDLRRRRT